MTIEQIAKLDQFKEHELHDTYNPNCSTCWSENASMQKGRVCPTFKCKGDGIIHNDYTRFCDACHKDAEGYDAGI